MKILFDKRILAFLPQKDLILIIFTFQFPSNNIFIQLLKFKIPFYQSQHDFSTTSKPRIQSVHFYKFITEYIMWHNLYMSFIGCIWVGIIKIREKKQVLLHLQSLYSLWWKLALLQLPRSKFFSISLSLSKGRKKVWSCVHRFLCS